MKEELFRTSEFVLAVTLVYHGIPLATIDRSISTRVQFCFKQSEELDLLIQSYWGNQIKVEPRAFNAQTKLLKGRLFSDR